MSRRYIPEKPVKTDILKTYWRHGQYCVKVKYTYADGREVTPYPTAYNGQ